MPHVQKFDNIGHLLELLLSADMQRISAGMRDQNYRDLLAGRDRWTNVTESVIALKVNTQLKSSKQVNRYINLANFGC